VKKVKGTHERLGPFCLAQNSQGSLLDKTQRIETDNPIFSRLQRAILHPSRTKEWFGMAEQVVNAIYALAEHPDVLCNEVIKKLTVRAFNRPTRAPEEQTELRGKEDEKGADSDTSMGENHPGITATAEDDVSMMDATQPLATQAATQDDDDDQNKDLGDAFELAQLLFVVGHVAIKHIVFLELVEREWKRQKDEKQAGWCIDFVPNPILFLIVNFSSREEGQ
jgi:condensin complex subunit 1